MRRAVIIAAGGSGKRMGGESLKQYLELQGRPLICHTLDRFSHEPNVIIAVDPGSVTSFQTRVIAQGRYPATWTIVEGGKERQDSVRNGLCHVPKECEIVLVHDAVRPFLRSTIIDAVVNAVEKQGAAIVAVPVRDTLKRVTTDRKIVETTDRHALWSAQTPQGFRVDLLRKAYDTADRDGFRGTDESSLVERLGVDITIVPGDEYNIKITTPADLVMAEAIMKNVHL